MKQRTYIAIDLKSFFASVECVERGLDALSAHPVAVDAARTELAAQNLIAKVVQQVSGEPDGTVLSQSPVGGTQVKMNTPVTLYVSTGITQEQIDAAAQQAAEQAEAADVADEAKKAADDKKSKPVKLTKEEIEKLTQQRQAEEKKRVSKLARLYNEMKPEEAAKIMENMESDIVIAIFQRMDESQVSQIMANFDAGKAASISKLMYVGVPKRVQQVTVDNQAQQQMQ